MLFLKGAKSFICKYKHFFILACLLAVLLCMAGWLYLDAVRSAQTHITLQRINEDYSIVSEPIAENSSLRQGFVTDEPIHGGSFVFTIYNKICYGNLTLSLEDESGNTLASTSIDSTTLLDNTYHDIAFNEPVIPNGLNTYYYVLTFAPTTPESELGVWISEGEVEGLLPFSLNGEQSEQTVGFSIIKNRAGSFITSSFFIFAVITLIVCALLYFALFVFKLKIHWVFLIASIGLGFIYMFVLPPYVAPDEETHIHTAYALSNNILGIENESTLSMRSADTVDFDFANSATVFSYQRVNSELFGMCEDSTIVATDNRVITSEPFILHLASAIGLTIGRLIGFNYTTIIILGRLCSLLFYAGIVCAAIRIMPKFKRVLAIVALLPMSLQLAASFNYDATVIATALLYTAVVFYFATSEKAITYKHILIVAILGIALAPMKNLYIIMCLICLLLPLKYCPSLVQKYMPKLLIVGFVFAALGFVLLLPSLGITAEGLASASAKVLPHVNPDSIDYVERDFWTPAYILTHISGAIKLLARTIEENTATYFVQLVGGSAGEPILRVINVWTPAVFAFLVMLPVSAMPTNKEKPLLKAGQKIWSALLCLATIAGLVFVCLTWTPLRSETLWGLQGRYLLPILPLALFTFQNKLFVLSRNIERELIMISVFGNIIAIASIFASIVRFQV